MALLTHITDDRIGVISLNRSEVHNALDMATLAELPEAFDRMTADPGVGVILLRGEGRSFCSGLDLAALQSGEATGGGLADAYRLVRAIQEQRLRMIDCPKPIVAALKGHVVGGGLELALAADIRVAADDARLSLPEFSYGISTDTGGSVLATILAGPSRAKLMLMTGRRIGAEQAVAWGLVDETTTSDGLDEAALTLCREIVAKPPVAQQMAKQLVDQTWEGAIRQGLRSELLAQVALFGDQPAR